MKAIKQLVKHVAPTIASALGGPFSGVATNFLLEKMGINGEQPASESTLLSILQSPESMVRLKELEKEFQNEMAKLEVDVFKLEVNDRESARQLAENTSLKPQVVISTLFLVAYFGLLAALLFVEVSDQFNMAKGENSLLGELQILLGVVTAGVGQILAFWFGGFKSKPASLSEK